jgi:hypothetical protein
MRTERNRVAIVVSLEGSLDYDADLMLVVKDSLEACKNAEGVDEDAVKLFGEIDRNNCVGSVDIGVLEEDSDEPNGRAVIRVPGVDIVVDADEMIRALKPFARRRR